MDDSALHGRLTRIEHRQRLVLVLLVVPYLLGIAEVVGYYVAGTLYTVLGVLGVTWGIARRRRRRDGAEQ